MRLKEVTRRWYLPKHPRLAAPTLPCSTPLLWSLLVALQRPSPEANACSIPERVTAAGCGGQGEALLNEGLPLHQRDSSGQTALLAATEKGRVDTVELLLLRGADPNMSDKMGVAALHVVVALKEEGEEGGDAARGARMRLVKLLLAQGADLNQGDALAFTPLHVRPCHFHVRGRSI